MEQLSKADKKARAKAWRTAQQKKYALNKTKVRQLFAFLERELEAAPCDHTLRRTEAWLCANCKPEDRARIVDEMHGMGGFCDCEVLLNCYECYDLA